jgi:hypothetical protein
MENSANFRTPTHMSARSIQSSFSPCFCFEDEGPLIAARLMDEYRLRTILVLNREHSVVGFYTLEERGVSFRRSVDTAVHARN